MLDFVAYQTAAKLTGISAREALPDAPTRPDPITVRRTKPLVAFRLQTSRFLRRLADHVEPAPMQPEPALSGCQ